MSRPWLSSRTLLRPGGPESLNLGGLVAVLAVEAPRGAGGGAVGDTDVHSNEGRGRHGSGDDAASVHGRGSCEEEIWKLLCGHRSPSISKTGRFPDQLYGLLI